MAKASRFPSEQELKRMRKALSSGEGARVLSAAASPLDRAKYEMCRQFVDYLLDNKLTQRELADLLKVSEARVSEIVRYRIEKLTMDRLLRYVERIDPQFTLKFA